MSKKLAVIAVHGMGETKSDFADDLRSGLEKRLPPSERESLHFDVVHYQPILQGNQDAVFEAMRSRKIDFIALRKFLLFGFSDAAGLERRPHEDGSPYELAQGIIGDALDRCAVALGDPAKPVVIVAQSLGCQVISNYLWDSQQEHPRQGIWKGKAPEGTIEDDFRRLKTLEAFFTTGCNIPIFVAGLSPEEIQAVGTSGNGYDFRWLNFYDRDDPFGWPLQPLGPSYAEAVADDIEINAASGLGGAVVRGWNPLCHGEYWGDRQFLDALVEQVRSSLAT